MTAYKTKIVKRIDLLLKVIFLIITYLYLYFEIFHKNKFSILFSWFDDNIFILNNIILVFVLMPLNWSIEAVKWKYSVKNIQNISFNKSLKAILAGVALGVFTPNRAGEVPGRALFLDNCRLWKATFVSSVSAFAQLAVTLVLGLLAIPFGLHYIISDFYIIISVSFFSILFSALILLVYFKVSILSKLSQWRLIKKYPNFCQQIEVFNSFSFKMLSIIFLLSLLRYLIFAIQFFLILNAFYINLSFSESVFFVSVYYFIITAIPTLALSEIGVRGAVGIYIFNIMGINESLMQLNLLIATILLWVINVVIPAVSGTFFIPSIKFKKLIH